MVTEIFSVNIYSILVVLIALIICGIIKKVIVALYILLLILFAIFIINFIRNYFILSDIYDLGSNFKTGNNYYIKETIDNNDVIMYIECYYKDNEYLYEITGEVQGNVTYHDWLWHNINTGEYIAARENELKELVRYEIEELNNKSKIVNDFIYSKSYEFEDLLKKNLFKIIKEKDGCFIINVFEQDEYVNKETGLLQKVVNKVNDVKVEILYKENIVTDEDLDIETITNSINNKIQEDASSYPKTEKNGKVKMLK